MYFILFNQDIELINMQIFCVNICIYKFKNINFFKVYLNLKTSFLFINVKKVLICLALVI